METKEKGNLCTKSITPVSTYIRLISIYYSNHYTSSFSFYMLAYIVHTDSLYLPPTFFFYCSIIAYDYLPPTICTINFDVDRS